MPIKVSLISLGCPKNQVDAEQMLAKLAAQGMEIADDPCRSEVIIVNTCGFIEDAKKESIEQILEAARLKAEGGVKGIVVTGCLSERYFDEFAAEFPEVDCVLSVGRAGQIVEAVQAACAGGRLLLRGKPEELDFSGERVRAGAATAYLKIAEGCDNHCTYCVIPSLRGRYRSRSMEEIEEEARGLAQDGVRELILVAQDTTAYGSDLYGRFALPELLRRLCRIRGLHWVRMLYCYPDRISDELIETMAQEEKIVKYMDLPIQHVSARIVRAMNRKMAREELEVLLAKLRERIPGIVLRTTLIVGFPGENEEDFEELAEFVKKAKFDRLGVFTYSQEEGTPAAKFDGQIEQEKKERRREILMLEQSHIAQENSEAKRGQTVEALVEGYDRSARRYYGRSRADAPDIDGTVFFTSAKRLRRGSFVNLHVTQASEYDLTGTVEAQPASTGRERDKA